MSISLIFQVLLALFKFPSEMQSFIILISKTPDEKRAELLKQIQDLSASLDAGGRPQWPS